MSECTCPWMGVWCCSWVKELHCLNGPDSCPVAVYVYTYKFSILISKHFRKELVEKIWLKKRSNYFTTGDCCINIHHRIFLDDARLTWGKIDAGHALLGFKRLIEGTSDHCWNAWVHGWDEACDWSLSHF